MRSDSWGSRVGGVRVRVRVCVCACVRPRGCTRAYVRAYVCGWVGARAHASGCQHRHAAAQAAALPQQLMSCRRNAAGLVQAHGLTCPNSPEPIRYPRKKNELAVWAFHASAPIGRGGVSCRGCSCPAPMCVQAKRRTLCRAAGGCFWTLPTPRCCCGLRCPTLLASAALASFLCPSHGGHSCTDYPCAPPCATHGPCHLLPIMPNTLRLHPPRLP